MRKITVLFLAATLFIPFQAHAKKESTTRGRLKPPTMSTATSTGDSVMSIDSGKILLRGYDKPLRSRKESVFVTNTLSDNVSRLHLTITYTDMEGRQLHSAARWVEANIPAGQTRQIFFPSWDKQQSFYYHLSRTPKTEAAPYRIKASIDSVAVK